jgi:hypothetical protein
MIPVEVSAKTGGFQFFDLDPDPDPGSRIPDPIQILTHSSSHDQFFCSAAVSIPIPLARLSGPTDTICSR